MVVELVRRDVEAVDELLRGNDRPRLVAAAREQVREQSLEDAEALRRERPCRSLERLDDLARLGPGEGFVGSPSWRSRTRSSPSLTSSAASGGDSGRARPSWRSTQPASRSSLE